MPKPTSNPSRPSKEIASHKHQDKRANIPTEELRDFVEEQEKAPKKMFYPRDPSLDPQLVWKGKDEQDAAPLEVPAVPIYIQEKIHPQAIIEDLRRQGSGGGSSPQAGKEERGDRLSPLRQPEFSLFADFNGIQFEQLIEFYQHQDGVNWANRMILGDSLLVMTSLAEKEGLKGKVQMVYLDPPYGIKFGSNWQVSTRKRDVKDGKAEDATRQPEQIRAFRDTWKLGIHSYLAYLRDRLVVARELLTESGSVFVQIGAENVHLVRCMLDETFGSENIAVQISFRKTSGLTAGLLAENADYLLWYAKDVTKVKFRQPYAEKGLDSDLAFYGYVELADGIRRRVGLEEAGSGLPPNSKPYSVGDLTSSHFYAEGTGSFEFEGQSYKPGTRFWTTSPTGMRRLAVAGRVHPSANSIRYVRFAQDFSVQPLTANWTDTITGQYSDPRLYVVQTATKVVQRCVLMTTDPGDLVLDPTCGSGTTAYVAEQWGRRWITCDTSRVALALARTRLMAGRFPYYLLADSEAGWRKEMEASGKFVERSGDSLSPAAEAKRGQAVPTPGRFAGDLKRGFVYQRVPHVTLKAIANNEEIDTIHAEFAPKLEKALAALNKAAKKSWPEWEVPRELPPDLVGRGSRRAQTSPGKLPSTAQQELRPTEIETAHGEFWSLRRERQKAMDASIARRADTELLYDQPYEDPKRIRVTGPFTVESLSPHRVLSADADQDGTVTEVEGRQHHDFVTMILDNLKKAGVQNTRKAERLKFDTLESYAGQWIHAVGTFEERAGVGTACPQEGQGKAAGDRLSPLLTRRAAICIGPEHGTVGPDLVKEAAKEAVQGVGFDLLIVCGFAFDPHISEEIKRYGKLAVVPARMNPDLAMGDELLKKTGAGNLFMVFGEPDVRVESGEWLVASGGRLIVLRHEFEELSGLVGLAEINRVGRENLRRLQTLSVGGAVRAETIARIQALTAGDFPLTTRHSTLVTLLGVDIYDPTTGQIRNSSTDDIACWFIDTDYNGESFFVRHAYFTGADEPYEKLQRALRADIDEAAWQSLYSTQSRPFERPQGGKIAIKVINHYGDEVLKVYEV